MHTKEPWSVRVMKNKDGEIRDCFVEAPREEGMAYGLEVLGDDYTGYGDIQRKEADCRRIVACVNACAGIPTELLEKDLISPDKAIVIKEQRDELLAAAKKIRPFIEEGEVPECFWSEPFKSALADFDEALAKCES